MFNCCLTLFISDILVVPRVMLRVIFSRIAPPFLAFLLRIDPSLRLLILMRRRQLHTKICITSVSSSSQIERSSQSMGMCSIRSRISTLIASSLVRSPQAFRCRDGFNDGWQVDTISTELQLWLLDFLLLLVSRRSRWLSLLSNVGKGKERAGYR